MALLLEECHWGGLSSSKKSTLFPVSTLYRVFLDSDVSSQLVLQHYIYLPDAMLPAIVAMDSETVNTK